MRLGAVGSGAARARLARTGGLEWVAVVHGPMFDIACIRYGILSKYLRNWGEIMGLSSHVSLKGKSYGSTCLFSAFVWSQLRQSDGVFPSCPVITLRYLNPLVHLADHLNSRSPSHLALHHLHKRREKKDENISFANRVYREFPLQTLITYLGV